VLCVSVFIFCFGLKFALENVLENKKKAEEKKWEEPRSPAPPPPHFGPKRGPAQQQQARLASPSPL